MRCTEIDGDARCPNKALRGMCYCFSHTPESEKGKDSLWTITKEAEAVLQQEDNGDDTMLAMKMLMAMHEEGTQPIPLARFLCVPDKDVQRIAKRFRDSEIWRGDKLCIEKDTNLDDDREVGIMFILYAMVGGGEVVRMDKKTKPRSKP